MATLTDSAADPIADHALIEEEIDKRATTENPFFKLSVETKEKTNPSVCYFSTEKCGLLYPPETEDGNQSENGLAETYMHRPCRSDIRTILQPHAQFRKELKPKVALKVVKLSKESRSGYVISSPILQDKYLQVTEQSLGSKKCTVKFTAPKQIKPLVFHQSQLFKYHKDPRSETKFAFYTTMVDGEGETKVYYLKPKSGVIVAEESSTPDGYLWSLLIAIATEERAETMQACRQLLTIGSAILWGHKWSICGPNPLSPRENQEYSPTEDCAYYWIDSESVW